MTETEEMKAQLSELKEELKTLKEQEDAPAVEPVVEEEKEAEAPAEEVKEPVEEVAEEKPAKEPAEEVAEPVAEEKADISEIKDSIGKMLKELKTIKASKVKLKGKVVQEKTDSSFDNYMFERTEFGKGFSMYVDPAKLDATKYQRLMR